tara:strand:+ start:2388 stop:2840 length:453 start_codon:yes stop_codon:yes gene_type:complete
MENLTKDICNIIITEIKTVNDKINGLNFLESMKGSLIDGLLPLIKTQQFALDKDIVFENEIEANSRNVKIFINYYSKPLSVTKKIVQNDSLLLTFIENLNIDYYKDQKSFVSILLLKNTGVTLPKNSTINSKSNKNIFLIEIINNEKDIK